MNTTNEESGGSLVGTTRQIRERFDRTIHALSSDSSSRVDLTNASERFELWAGSVGAAVDAHKKISLEWRLRDAPDIVEAIYELQCDLIEALDDLYQIATGQRENRTRDVTAIELEQDEESEQAPVEIPAIDETQSILEVILDCVRGLLRLSILIRKATPRDRWNRALQKTREDRFDDHFDVHHVGEKFPKLNKAENEWLKTRLGRAITQRRQFIRYCREHKNQMTTTESTVNPIIEYQEQVEPVEFTEVLERFPAAEAMTLAPPITEGSTKASTLQVTTLDAIRIDDDDDATSVASSVVSSLDPTNKDEHRLHLPSLQAVSQGHDEFECPLCFTIQTFRHSRKWKKHAFADLKPYVCCSGKGECDLELFGDRNTWFTHELENHRHQWTCFLCQKEFSTLDRFQSHMQTKHSEVPREQLDDVAKLCKKPLPLIPATDCPFCDEYDSTLREAQLQNREHQGTTEPDVILVPALAFRRHLASHLEQLALFAMGTQCAADEPTDSESAHSRAVGSVRDAGIMDNYLGDQDTFERESHTSRPHTSTEEGEIELGSDDARSDHSTTSRGSMALDQLAAELDALRSHWETSNKNYRLSDRFDFEKPLTSEEGGLSESLSQWRKRLAPDEDERSKDSGGNERPAAQSRPQSPLLSHPGNRKQSVDRDSVHYKSELETYNAQRSRLADLQSKLVLRPGMHRVELQLGHIGRELIHEGDLQRARSNSSQKLDTHVILFDHYMILAKTVSNTFDMDGGLVPGVKYNVSLLPIPMDLLRLEYGDDDRSPIGFGGIDTYRYPFQITHLGKETYTLYASSGESRTEWCTKIVEAKTKHARALEAQHAEPFSLRVIASKAFAIEDDQGRRNQRTSISGREIPKDTKTQHQKSIVIENTPLYRALEADRSSDGTPVCRASVNCATSYKTRKGLDIIAVGTDEGVYVMRCIFRRSWSTVVLTDGNSYSGHWIKIVEDKKVTQLAFQEEFTLLMVLSDNELITYDLRDWNQENPTKSVVQLTRNHEVRFFTPCQLKDRHLVIYCRPKSFTSIFKVLEAVEQTTVSKATLRFLNRNTSTTAISFRDFDEFIIPTACSNLNVFKSSLAVATNGGFEVLTLDKKQPYSVPDLGQTHVKAIAERVKHQKPLAMFRLAQTEFLCCWDRSAVYINKHGDISRSVIMEFVGTAQHAVMRSGSLLLFNQEFVEIRNAQNGRLRQVIEGRNIRCIDDGTEDRWNVKMAMQHPKDEQYQLLLELISNEAPSPLYV